MVDAAAEIRKLEKQLGQVETRATALQKQMAIPGYEEKVRCGVDVCVCGARPILDAIHTTTDRTQYTIYPSRLGARDGAAGERGQGGAAHHGARQRAQGH